LYVDYRYTKKSEEIKDSENVQSISGKLNVPVTDRLSLLAEHEQNIEENLRIRTAVGFTYQAQCWSFDFKYTDEPNDRSYAFKVNLLGLGGAGY
jgi:lipopolysaccharide assembly outer membrane protein LptD (OstA)